MLTIGNVLFNALKHHLQSIKSFKTTLTPDNLRKELQTLGGAQMDLYYGSLSKDIVKEELIEGIKSYKIYNREDFLNWIMIGMGFQHYP